MHFRKAYLLLFQVRYSLLPLSKYLVRKNSSIIWVNFYGFGLLFGKKKLINSVCVLFHQDSLDVFTIK